MRGAHRIRIAIRLGDLTTLAEVILIDRDQQMVEAWQRATGEGQDRQKTSRTLRKDHNRRARRMFNRPAE